MSKKILTVFGATGNQGGSIVSVFLANPNLASKYTIRAITRDTSKPAAKELASKGCEVVAADLSSPSSLSNAVSGSYGVFAVTNYWESMKKEVELSQGRAIADACIAAGVRHFVWSSLPNTTKLTGGKLPLIEHFDAKAEVEEYIEANKSKSSSGLWATYFMPAFFMSNFQQFINPGPDGSLTYAAPYGADANLPLIDIRGDTGKYVLGAFEAGASADGIRIQGTSQWVTPSQVAEIFSTSSGAGDVKFVQIPRDVYKGFLTPTMGEHAGEELTQNMELIGGWDYFGKGTKEKQAESEKFVLQGTKLTSLEGFVKGKAPWKFGA